VSMGLFLSELTFAISQRTFCLYSETWLIRHYAEPNNYVGFNRVSQYSVISITRIFLLQFSQFDNALIFFVIELKGKNNIYTQIESNTCSVHLYPQLFVGGLMSHLRYLCLFAQSGDQHILCCVFVLFFVLCTLCCQCLWIVHFGIL
jgi:hypothetical protein